MSKHSPTPWRWEEIVRDDYCDSDMDQGGFVDASNKVVCHFGDSETYYPSKGESLTKADTDFVLRAVNSHDKLLAACKAVVEWNSRIGAFCNREDEDVMNLLSSAIAEAEAT